MAETSLKKKHGKKYKLLRVLSHFGLLFIYKCLYILCHYIIIT